MPTEKAIDLFGDLSTIPEKSSGRETILSRWSIGANYRSARGEEKQCQNCQNFIVRRFSGKYFKCKMIGGGASTSTDIRAHNVCRFHKPNE
jgi:hypothetical protein